MNDREPKTSREELYQWLDTTVRFPYSRREYVRRYLWEWTECTVFRHSPRRARSVRRALLRMFGATMTDTSKVRRTVTITHPWLLTMGEHSVIGENVTVYNLGPITIGDHTVISQNVHLCAGTHDHHRTDLPLMRSTIRIGSGVWICADAFIGPDVTIGDNAIVGARAVVMKNVPAGTIVVGNPARVVSNRPRPEAVSGHGTLSEGEGRKE